MTGLASIVALSTNTGTRCSLSLVKGLLKNGMSLELYTEDGWQPLTGVRIVIDAEPAAYLYLAGQPIREVSPDDLIRVRIVPKGR
jgi:hypothetical protein